jgi:hypothetical protein
MESQEKKLAKLDKFRLEYDDLKAERAKLREEIMRLDGRMLSEDLSKKQRDKELRLKLARAGEISRRIAEVIAEMAQLGKIPEGYQ